MFEHSVKAWAKTFFKARSDRDAETCSRVEPIFPKHFGRINERGLGLINDIGGPDHAEPTEFLDTPRGFGY
jgi:hypothetical protein